VKQNITLSESQISSYHRQGFLVLENLLSQQEVDAFLSSVESRPRDFDPGLRFHIDDPQYEYVAKHPNVAGVAAQVLGGTPCIVQTMYMPKRAGQPGQANAGIALHQDTHYLPTEPNTLMACWVALSDTSGENGGLCVVPGSHKHELARTHQTASDEHHSWRQECQMRDRSGKEWTETFYSFEIDNVESLPIQQLAVPRGGGVIFTGMTIHGSYANHSPTQDRLAFAVHYVKEGTWVIRADVQETVAVTAYSIDTG
jgi:ectoine hydroxylase-related dioxygenase (phytanoyl-CoA dioxygenase family)